MFSRNKTNHGVLTKHLFCFLFFLVIIFFVLPSLTQAEEEAVKKEKEIYFLPQVSIPTLESNIPISGRSIGYYISAFYRWAVIAMAVLAVAIIMVAGLRWIFSAGNPAAIKQAQDQLFSALIGLVLILIAVPMLNMINPALVKLENLRIPSIEREEWASSPPPMLAFLVDYEEIKFRNLQRSKLNEVKQCESSENFCLYGQRRQRDNRGLGYDDSGKGVGVGGPRALVAAIFFPGKIGVENVAVRGYWTDGSSQKIFLCSDNEKGCGAGQEDWDITIHQDKMTKEICDLAGLNHPCSMVLATKAGAVRWFPKKPGEPFGDVAAMTRQKTRYKIFIEMFSRKDEFPSVSKTIFFNQTCGSGICSKGTGKKYCCKQKKDLGNGHYYYDFHCSLAVECPRRNKDWEAQEKDTNIYCGLFQD